MLGAIVSFYFGARYQAKGQDFQRSIASTVARAPHVAESIRTLRALNPSSPGVADNGGDADLALTALTPTDNPALAEWRRQG